MYILNINYSFSRNQSTSLLFCPSIVQTSIKNLSTAPWKICLLALSSSGLQSQGAVLTRLNTLQISKSRATVRSGQRRLGAKWEPGHRDTSEVKWRGGGFILLAMRRGATQRRHKECEMSRQHWKQTRTGLREKPGANFGHKESK